MSAANGRNLDALVGVPDFSDRLRAGDWIVRPIALPLATRLVKANHYARGGSNTATYLHGLFRREAFWEDDCAGVAWWIPPTKSAALATYPADWQGVLALSRLVIVPGVPKNACTFLLARSMKAIDRKRWPCLVTYADEWQGHTGTIYRAANWVEVGKTAPEATFVLDGRMVARKAGPRTRTRSEMEGLGARMIGRYAKRKFVHVASHPNKEVSVER
jgi:hypothetical protein